MIPWLEDHTPFPPVEHACTEPNGLLAASAAISPERLIEAYQKGIFPWYSDDQPVLWWSPSPRMVLFPEEFRLSRSLRKTLRHETYEVRLDTAFHQVMAGCAGTPRPGQDGTWITPEICSAYGALHELGMAHSVETWVNDELVGGLYGVAIGRMFYGESMFMRRRDASKIAFAHLIRYLSQEGYGMIDCQMKTGHLASLGAREIARAEFMARLTTLTGQPPHTHLAQWPADAARSTWE